MDHRILIVMYFNFYCELFTVVAIFDLWCNLFINYIHDVHRDHEGSNGLPWGMKSYPIQFSRFPYYEHLQITHLFDTMYIGKNVIETSWWLLELRREKDKVVKVCKDIQESNRAMKDVIQFHTNGEQVNINSIPWMLWSNKAMLSNK